MVCIDDLHPHPSEDTITNKILLKLQLLVNDVKQWIDQHPFIVEGAIIGSLFFMIAATRGPLLLGFGASGPVKTTFAAKCMRLFGGHVPPNSLYSIIQSFSMTATSKIRVAQIGAAGAITGATVAACSNPRSSE